PSDLPSLPTRRSSDLAGVDRNSIVIDRVARRAVVSAEPLAGATFATYRELEQRAAATMTDWEIRLSPPVLALSEITFDGEEPDEDRKSTRLNSSHVKI